MTMHINFFFAAAIQSLELHADSDLDGCLNKLVRLQTLYQTC